MGIHIITDSASDIKTTERENLTIIPLTITFGETEYQDGVTLTHKQFYEMLIENDTLPVTSQIPPFLFEEAIKKAVAQGDEVITITLSAKLSGTWQSAMIAAENYPGFIYVVDSENVSIGEHILVEYALRLVDSGLSAAEIVEKLNLLKKRIRLVALLDTLEYLKKGGRISGAAALAGSI
ncbi:MAG: DegV family protein, partial [Acetatifactor sp.]|nr:DegV family protein [Acetatifactor sp.]